MTRTNDFEMVKNCYLDVIAHTPGIAGHARWEYGKHPTDALLQGYIERGEMYILTDGDAVAGVAAITMCQGEDYAGVAWKEDLPDNEVATIHLLAVLPEYRGRTLGSKILEEAMELAVRNGKKALRLDTLKSNLPSQKMYEKAGFVCRGEAKYYYEDIGELHFLYYEKLMS